METKNNLPVSPSETAITRTPAHVAADINKIKMKTAVVLALSAVEMGRLLLEAKALVPHGEWGKWLEERVEFEKSTANNLMKIYEEYSIILTVGIYARNDKFNYIRNDLDEITSEYEEILEIHGFYVYEDLNLVSFDMIVDFDADKDKIKDEVLSKIKDKHPEFEYIIIDDYDISD